MKCLKCYGDTSFLKTTDLVVCMINALVEVIKKQEVVEGCPGR